MAVRTVEGTELQGMRLVDLDLPALQKSFFRSWFKDGGGSFFFLFRRNLYITNISHAELMSLLRIYATFVSSNKNKLTVQFETTVSLKKMFISLWDSLGRVRA